VLYRERKRKNKAGATTQRHDRDDDDTRSVSTGGPTSKPRSKEQQE